MWQSDEHEREKKAKIGDQEESSLISTTEMQRNKSDLGLTFIVKKTAENLMIQKQTKKRHSHPHVESKMLRKIL